jgi:hypothetical protein
MSGLWEEIPTRRTKEKHSGAKPGEKLSEGTKEGIAQEKSPLSIQNDKIKVSTNIYK